ncbi:MAG: NADH-quinone oxidoreductase subunit K, partial [Acidobacteria bacterium]
MIIPQSHLMILSLVLLTIGVVGVLIRRNVIIILMSIEL